MKLAIFDLDNWREIGATLSRNKTRTFLTAFGIFWGTAMLAMLHGGAVGLAGTMTRNFEGFATNMAAVIPDQTSISYKGFNKGMYWSMTTDDVERTCRMSRAIDLKSPIIGRYGNIAYGSKYTSGNVNGVTSDYWRIQEVKLYAGRVLNENDDRRKAKNVMIGKNVSDELFGSDPSAAIGKFVKDRKSVV